jgi:Ni,Fe-hydrogenase maturation factor
LLAKALGILPAQVFIVGCQPVEVDEVGIGLSESVERAATETIGHIERLVRQLLAAR